MGPKKNLTVQVFAPCSNLSPSSYHAPMSTMTNPQLAVRPFSTQAAHIGVPADYSCGYTPLSARMSTYPRTPLHALTPTQSDCPLDMNAPFELSQKYLKDFDNFFSTKLFRPNGEVVSKVLPVPKRPVLKSRFDLFKRDRSSFSLPPIQRAFQMKDFEVKKRKELMPPPESIHRKAPVTPPLEIRTIEESPNYTTVKIESDLSIHNGFKPQPQPAQTVRPQTPPALDPQRPRTQPTDTHTQLPVDAQSRKPRTELSTDPNYRKHVRRFLVSTPEKIEKLNQQYEEQNRRLVEQYRQREELNRPRQVLNHAREVLNSPQEVLNRPQEVLSHPQEILNRPQEALNHPQEVHSRPCEENINHSFSTQVEEHPFPAHFETRNSTPPVKQESSPAKTPSASAPASSPSIRSSSKSPILDHKGMAGTATAVVGAPTNVERLMADPAMWAQATQVKKGVYVCTHCPSHLGRFRKLSELAAHFDEHKLTRLCKCDYPNCAWSIVGFSSRSEKTRHIKSQHVTAQYECMYCLRIFARSDSLKRHFKLIHNIGRVTSKELKKMTSELKVEPVCEPDYKFYRGCDEDTHDQMNTN